MKIMTFNIQHGLNFVTKKIDFDVMAKAINDCGADIVGLNEMRDKGLHPEYTAQVKKLSELTGLKNHYFAKATELHGGNPYGNGFLSRFAITSAATVMIPDPDPKMYDGYYETRCVLKATLENGYTVLVTHFGLNEDEQQNAVNTILPLIKDEKCILMGDFNVTPDHPVLRPIYERMKDTSEMFEGEKLSFPSDVPDRKIDYLFVSPDVEVISADIPALIASDHRPHVAEIK